MIFISKFLDSHGPNIYPAYDYWHTSPSFFIIRIGMLLLLTAFAHGWCRWGPAEWGFSPLIQLGKTSLLVYWVHIELVYGKFAILQRRSQNVLGASEGLLTIFIAMLALSLLRTRLRGRFEWIALAPRPHAPSSNFLSKVSQNTVSSLLTSAHNESRIHAIY